jgi:hypothetical protein
MGCWIFLSRRWVYYDNYDVGLEYIDFKVVKRMTWLRVEAKAEISRDVHDISTP